MKKIVLLSAITLIGLVQNVNAQIENNDCGVLVIPAVYDKIELGNDGLFVVSQGKKKGVLDSNGKTVIPIQYDNIILGENGKDCGGLILVSNEISGDDSSNDMYGLYYKDGTQLFPLGKYDYVSIKNYRGYKGFAIIRNDGSEYIFFKNGKVSQSYDQISQCESGLFTVSKNGLYGVLNKNGEVIIPIVYEDILSRYDNGLIEVGNPYKNGERKWGVLNDKGEVVVPIGKYESVDVKRNSYIVVEKNKKKGIVNSKGMVIVPIGAYESCGVRECLERSQYYIEISSNGKKGVVNDNGKVIVPIGKYNQFRVLNKDLIAVMQNDKQGLIDKNGTMILPIGKYEQLGYIYGVLTYSQNGKWGILDKKGNQATPAEYDKIEPARHSIGMALVAKDGKVGVLNSEGKQIMAMGSYSNGALYGNIGFFKSNEGTVLFNLEGKIMAPTGKYEKCSQQYGKLLGQGINNWPIPINPTNGEEGIYLVENKGKYGVVKLW